MKFVVFAVLLLACSAVVIKAQSCLTHEDVTRMLAQAASSTPPAPNQTLKEELLKMAFKQREALLQVVEKNQTKKSDQEKLHKIYEEHTARFCELIKTNGWPTTALVDEDGVLAAFHILKNAAALISKHHFRFGVRRSRMIALNIVQDVAVRHEDVDQAIVVVVEKARAESTGMKCRV